MERIDELPDEEDQPCSSTSLVATSASETTPSNQKVENTSSDADLLAKSSKLPVQASSSDAEEGVSAAKKVKLSDQPLVSDETLSAESMAEPKKQNLSEQSPTGAEKCAEKVGQETEQEEEERLQPEASAPEASAGDCHERHGIDEQNRRDLNDLR